MAWAEGIKYDSQGFLLDVPRWDFLDSGITCVLGESGSGKTTLLQVMAGLILCPSFKMSLQGELVTEAPPRARNTGFVFQDYALFPHMTAWQNIAFAAEARGLPHEGWSGHGEQLVKRLGLGRIRNQKANTLSGGEQQRVALARALVSKPRIVFLDEPLSALDEKLKDEARNLISELALEFKVPFIFVTHDLRDVRLLADSLLLLSNGRVLAMGTAREILSVPPTLEAARALGENQILKVQIDDAPLTGSGTTGCRLAGASIQPGHQIKMSGGPCLVAKKWSFEAHEQKKQAARNPSDLTAKIIRCRDEGARFVCDTILSDGQHLTAWSAKLLSEGAPVSLVANTSTLVLYS